MIIDVISYIISGLQIHILILDGIIYCKCCYQGGFISSVEIEMGFESSFQLKSNTH